MLNDSEMRAERDKRADKHTQDEVKGLKDKGYVAYVIDREIDTFSAKNGFIWLCDNKFSDNDEFYIDSSDIIKGLDEAKKLASALNNKVQVGFRVDMWFCRHKSKNRTYIPFTDTDRGWSRRVNRTVNGRIKTLRVKRGGI